VAQDRGVRLVTRSMTLPAMVREAGEPTEGVEPAGRPAPLDARRPAVHLTAASRRALQQVLYWGGSNRRG
jgi:hypothetical protein